jgi:glutamyl-tRNA synthetase
MKYKTRFAPSPTGMLHVGGVRTALFDYLAAKNSGGEFILRIEDTDRERFVEGAVEAIHEGLNWLGIKYDGEVISQSERVDLYKKFAQELLDKGLAYKCFCTTNRLAKLKEDQISAKLAPAYDRHCLNLTSEEIIAKETAGNPYVIRFKIPESPSEVSWDDKIRGTVKFQTNTLEDFIIIKSDGWPTYNFANVIDDHDMNINLVIRGDEFVPSTPKHILLYQAFGWNHPEFAHVPVIVGSDMKKLSKRNGDTAISEYINKGYLPEALINFLAFLGWNPGTTEEIFSLSELEKAFSVDRIGTAPAVFDIERLNYINGVYIRKLKVSELVEKLLEFNADYKNIEPKFLKRVVSIEHTRIKTLADFDNISSIYWSLPNYNKDLLIFKKSDLEKTKLGLNTFINKLENTKIFDQPSEDVNFFQGILESAVKESLLSNGDVLWPVRVALSGQEKSASPAELLWALGKEESLRRIKAAL